MKSIEQLELEFNRQAVNRLAPRRQRRMERAQWWFGQMRNVVERATGWPPVPPPRPRQQSLPV